MAKRSKFNPTELEKQTDHIKPTLVGLHDKVSFNFRRLCYKQGGKFDYRSHESSYFLKLVERLQAISNMKKMEFIQPFGYGLRCHPIHFKDTTNNLTERTFGILGEDIDDEARQFEISTNEYGRVHGFFVENVFYIVWLDKHHELDPGTRQT